MADENEMIPEETLKVAPLAMYYSDVTRLSVGGHDFTPKGDKGHLELFEQEDVDAFEVELARLAKSSPAVRHLVKTLSVAAAEKLVATIRPVAAQGALTSDVAKAAQTLGANLTGAK